MNKKFNVFEIQNAFNIHHKKNVRIGKVTVYGVFRFPYTLLVTFKLISIRY